MYGIVNKAIEDLVIANFGEEKWEAIKDRSGIDIDFLLVASHTMMMLRLN